MAASPVCQAATKPNSPCPPACVLATRRWTWSTSPHSKAGDVIFFMDGAQTHGTLPWTGDAPRRSALYKYAGRTATRSGVSIELAAPEVYWDEAIVEGMTPEQRAVMYGPCSSISQKLHLQVDSDGNVALGK